MSHTDARVRIVARTRALLFAWVWVAMTAAAFAAEIPLPGDTIARLTAACPDCAKAGWLACGSQEVGWGRAFPKHALRGTPKRGYLIASEMTGEEFRNVARNTAWPTLQLALRRKFDRARLVALEDGFAEARLIGNPRQSTVTFPAPLHACVYGTWRPWGCCVGKCKDEECCEKSLGSPTVEVVWKDGDETLTLHYSHTVGLSWLERRAGDTSVRYACLVDATGKLKPSDAK